MELLTNFIDRRRGIIQDYIDIAAREKIEEVIYFIRTEAFVQ